MHSTRENESEDANPQVQEPWYRASKDVQPFALHKTIWSLNPNASTFCCTAPFPWSNSSIRELWDGQVTNEEILLQWKDLVREYGNTIVTGGKGKLLIYKGLATAKPICVKLEDPSMDVQCAAWALSLHAPTDPLIVFTTSSIIFVFDLKRGSIVGKLRGHGGLILSISVHPSHPYLFCTTSRDFTSRIYDLSLPPLQAPSNPHWPPLKHPSFAGPAHGLHMTDSEGEGIGRCVAVLVGGRSGGHKGAVFCSAFHPTMPLIATCGMDRAVKIWKIPSQSPGVLAREDKPLFSTDLIHKARVLSISWLSDDTLVSHSAPALMRSPVEGDLYHEEGTIVVWQWLSIDRFFRGDVYPKVMRGCAIDYRQSESFKVLSAYHLPLTTLDVHIFTSRHHDPILLVPMGKLIRVFNITDFEPRDRLPFPVDDGVEQLTKRMRLDEDGNDGDVAEGSRDIPESTPAQGVHLRSLFQAVEGWDVSAAEAEVLHPELPDITSCTMAFRGRCIFGVGARGTLCIWRLKAS